MRPGEPTSDPDEVQLGGLLALLVADGLNGQLELLPVQRILHAQFLLRRVRETLIIKCVCGSHTSALSEHGT